MDASDGAMRVITQNPVPGYEVLAGGGSRVGKDVGFVGGVSGDFVYARWFDRRDFAKASRSGP